MTLREAIEAKLRVSSHEDALSGTTRTYLTVRVWSSLIGVEKEGEMISRKWGAAFESTPEGASFLAEETAKGVDRIESALRAILTTGLHPLHRPEMQPGDGPGVQQIIDEWDRDVRPHAVEHRGGNKFMFRCKRLAILKRDPYEILWSEPADWVKAEGKA